ncbi:short chain dehydrogenase/reductase family oxidoreductase [Rhodopirellula baltica SH28]|uniref:Short chain dehydrogenase/reductase family oxidoreductase n=1 Tax=Rhodopirellula baltica SH28 TaxID=993517 RepID=K5CBJ0_RHOBT|nr:SDR family oxidoreductase [Rhodopirellula baltica]EKK00750.1 short chain dehydrogenase/reductase family oxidoreductase [Rhodopirellula baltica SH28]
MSTLRKFATAAAAGYAGIVVTRAIVRRKRTFDWRNKRVVITGGSRGLGLVIARQLADQGARIAITARTEEDLSAAAAELRRRGAEVIAHPCDIRDREQVATFIDRVTNQFDGIDVLLNVAGIITVGPFESMTMEDFQSAMQTNCWGALHVAMEVLPHMRAAGWGRIVNIASLGGKRAVPHMLPYAASKFALVGLSNGMRAELKADNIFVTTACPSLMRTGSPRNAIFKGQHRDEYAWFSIGDSLPGLSMNAEAAAEQILTACQHGRGEVFIRSPLNVTIALQNLFPELTQEILALAASVLPKMGGIGRTAAKGHQSQSEWSPSVLTTLTEQAAIRNNQI